MTLPQYNRNRFPEYHNDLLDRSVAWMGQAACRDVGAETFFPPDHDGQVAIAAKFCWACPARVACLEYAFVLSQVDGVWGGLSEHERTSVARAMRRQFPTPQSWLADKGKTLREALRAYLVTREVVENEYRRTGKVRRGRRPNPVSV